MVFAAERSERINQWVVTADQMRSIEARVFAAGMPVAALMEKVAGLISQRIQTLFPIDRFPQIGVLVGSGHNGGDALVVARELVLQGYEVKLCCPFDRQKDLTATHLRYAQSLGIPCAQTPEALQDCDGLIDGLFGFGLTRSVEGAIADLIHQVNAWRKPVVSIDLPSGLHTDTGQVLGTAIQATHTLCLGLWKLGLLQDEALAWVGEAELIDFGLPIADIEAVLGPIPKIQRITDRLAIACLPLHRPAATHKYRMGHLLLIVGSQAYSGAALLAGFAARATGVGMLSIAVPASLKPILTAQLPDALILPCPETPKGAIADLPPEIRLDQYQAIAVGCGLTPEASTVVNRVLEGDRLLVLDADALNIVGDRASSLLPARSAPTILTPHTGEFERLFPGLLASTSSRTEAVIAAAQASQAIVLLKGARVAIGAPSGEIRINPSSSPALARGGSGDVLTGLLGGLLAQGEATGDLDRLLDVVQSAAWWHAQAGRWGAQTRTEMGVDAQTLTDCLIPAIGQISGQLACQKGLAS